jgi:RimJ/RimL family protein N-acetyltransferase
MSTPPTGVALVAFGRQHLASTLQWTNDPELARLLDRRDRVTDDEHHRWFDSLSSRHDTVFFAIEDESRHIGNVWLADINARHRKAEVRIVLAPNATNRGRGSRAIELVTVEAFGRMNLHRLYAFVLAFNPRGRRAFEKAGFAIEGTLRDDRVDGAGFVDAVLLSRINTITTAVE